MIRRFSLAAALTCAIAAPAGAAEQDLDIPNTDFVGATAFTRQVAGSPVRIGYLFYYSSDLGEALRLRPVAQDELDEIRRVCFFMQTSADANTSTKVDDFFIEFASGEGDPQSIPDDKRFVFVFTRERGCASDPTPIELK